MKKFLALLLSLMMILSLAACGENKNEPAVDATVVQGEELNIDTNDENVEVEGITTEDTLMDALTDLGYDSVALTQNVNTAGMVSWSGAIVNPTDETAEHAVDLYAIVFNYTGSPEDAEAKLAEMRKISSDFDIFMADIEDEMVIVIGGNGDYYDDAMELIHRMGY